jgi:hypothetical protein
LPEAVKVVQGMVDAGSKIGTITPLAALATPEGMQKASNTLRQQGGNIEEPATQVIGGSEGLNALPYTLLGTVGLISLAGIIVTYYRAKKHVTPQYDDVPPQPGVLRKPDQEKSSRAT